MAREILLSNVLPEVLIALATVAIVWFGVKRGLAPLARLSEEIKERSPLDLHALDAGRAPEETRPLIAALNGLLGEVAAANRNQQRFLANAAHQLRTPLAGLQAHTELALSQPMPDACRTQVEQVHEATMRTARLANQLLALARAEPGGHTEAPSRVDLKAMVEGVADEWVHRALERDLDLGFDLRRRACAATSSCCARRSPTCCTTQSSTRRAARTSRSAPGCGATSRTSRLRTRGPESRPRSASACSTASTACRGPPAPAAAWAWRSCARSRRATAPDRDRRRQGGRGCVPGAGLR